MFMVTTEMTSKLLDSSGEKVPLNAGMIAQIDIIRGKQTLLEYFCNLLLRLKTMLLGNEIWTLKRIQGYLRHKLPLT